MPFYQDPTSGNDTTGVGSAAAPWATIDKVRTGANAGGGLVNGDRVLLCGTNVEAVNFAGISGVSFDSWSGVSGTDDGAIVNGATDPGAANWTVHSGTTYKVTIGASIAVSNVRCRWGSQVDGSGRHYGWMMQGIDPGGGALSAADQFFCNEITGVLYVRLADGGDPRTLTGEDTVRYTRTSREAAMKVQTGSYCTILGEGTSGFLTTGGGGSRRGQVGHYLSTGGAVYGLLVCGTGQVIRDIRLDECEEHSVVIASSETSRCLIENVDCWGTGKSSSASPFAAYSDTGNVVCTFRKCTARCYMLLGSTGNPLLYNRDWSAIGTPHPLQGFYGHTSGAANREVTDLLYDECVVYGYGTTAATHSNVTPYNAGNTPAAAPTNYKRFSHYPVRVLRSRAHGCSRNILAGHMAFRGCFLDFTKAPYDTSGQLIGSVNGDTTNLYEKCVLVFGTDRGSSNRCAWYLYAGARLVLHHCTVILVGTVNWYHDVFNVASAAAYGAGAGFRVEAKSTIFKFSQADGAAANENRLFLGDNGAPSGNYDFSGCVYHNIKDGSYSEDPARNGAAEWIAAMDPRGRVADPGLLNATSVDHLVAGQLAATSSLRTPANKRVFGVDAGRPGDGRGYGFGTVPARRYDGTVGAVQRGAVG